RIPGSATPRSRRVVGTNVGCAHPRIFAADFGIGVKSAVGDPRSIGLTIAWIQDVQSSVILPHQHGGKTGAQGVAGASSKAVANLLDSGLRGKQCRLLISKVSAGI